MKCSCAAHSTENNKILLIAGVGLGAFVFKSVYDKAYLICLS